MKFQVFDVQETYAREFPDVSDEYTQFVCLFGKTIEGESVRLLVKNTPHEIYVAVGADFTQANADLMKEALNAYCLRFRHACVRTECEACESRTTFGNTISRELCVRNRRFDSEAVRSADIVWRNGFEAYEPAPRPFCRFILTRSYFAKKAKEFLSQSAPGYYGHGNFESAPDAEDVFVGHSIADRDRGVYECISDCVESFMVLKNCGGFIWFEALKLASRTVHDIPVVEFCDLVECQDMGVKNAPLCTLTLDIETISETYVDSRSARFEYPVGSIAFNVNAQGGSGGTGGGNAARDFSSVFVLAGNQTGDVDWPKKPDSVTVRVFELEKDLLLAFQEAWIAAQPDFVTGYNSNNYDLPYIFGRALVLGLHGYANAFSRTPTLNRTLQKRILIEKAGQKKSQTLLDCPGVSFPDVLVMIREMYGFSPDDYRLGTVAEFYKLGEKDDFEYDEIHGAFHGSAALRGRLVSYNYMDVVLARKIWDKTKTRTNFIASCQVQRCRPRDKYERGLSYRLTRLCRMYMRNTYVFLSWRRAVDGGAAAGSKKRSKDIVVEDTTHLPVKMREIAGFEWVHARSISGGRVLEPKPKLYKTPIMIFDLNSLYPTICQELNICRSTSLPSTTSMPPDKCYVSPANFAYVRPEIKKGIYPTIMEAMVNARNDVRKKLKECKNEDDCAAFDALQQEFKVVANALYGQCASDVSQLTLKSGGISITKFGANIAERACTALLNHPEFASLGLEEVYGDTDSIFFTMNRVENETQCRAAWCSIAREPESEFDSTMQHIQQHVPPAYWTREMRIETARKLFPVIANWVNKQSGVLTGKLKFGMDDLLDTTLMRPKKKHYVKVSRSLVPRDMERKLVVKGMVTRQLVPFIRESFRALLEMKMLHDAPIEGEIRRLMQEIYMGAPDYKQFKHTAALTKPIDEYARADKHVIAAIQLRALGLPVTEGDRVEYYYGCVLGRDVAHKSSQVIAAPYVKKNAFMLNYSEYAKEFERKLHDLQYLVDRPIAELCRASTYQMIEPKYRSVPSMGTNLDVMLGRRTGSVQTDGASASASSHGDGSGATKEMRLAIRKSEQAIREARVQLRQAKLGFRASASHGGLGADATPATPAKTASRNANKKRALTQMNISESFAKFSRASERE